MLRKRTKPRELGELIKNAIRMLIIVSRLAPAALADAQIDFVYDPDLDQTVATYSGNWVGTGSASTDPTGITQQSLNWSNDFEPGFVNLAGPKTTKTFSSPLIDVPWVSTPATSASGDIFGFAVLDEEDLELYGPLGFTSSTTMNGSLTFAGSDLTELGFDANEIANGGTINLVNGDVVTWTATTIPEPSSLVLTLSAVMAALTVRRRTRK